MPTTCQACAGRATLFLCPPCTNQLRDMLTGLPRWLDYLADAIHGQTKLGANDGPRPKGGDDEQPMRINLGASGLAAATHATLVAIARTVEDSHGVQMTPLRATQPGFIGPLLPGWRRLPAGYVITRADLALWLAEHVTALAAHEAAGEHYHDVERIISDIERRINRPVPPRFCGPCPTQVEYNHNQSCERRHPHACGTALMARREAVEVRCPSCKATHTVERLLQRLLADVDHWRFTVAEILMIMRALDEPLNERTFRRWRRHGPKGEPPKVRPRGFRRPDGAIGLTRRTEDDEPLYRLAEVRAQARKDREMVTA